MRASRVFVSHTSDMARFPVGRSFVRAVLDALARAGTVPVDMQYFAAREGQPADYCQQRVRAVLLAAVDRAATTGFDTYAWRLVWTLEDFLDRRGHWHDWVTACRAALAAAGRQADPNAHAAMRKPAPSPVSATSTTPPVPLAPAATRGDGP